MEKDKLFSYIRMIPAGIYNGLIWTLSSQSIALPIPGIDKTAHIIEYAMLGLLLSFGFKVNNKNFDISAKSCILSGIILGSIDEIHQYFVPGRTMDIIDLFADITGICTGIVLWVVFLKIFTIIGKNPQPNKDNSFQDIRN